MGSAALRSQNPSVNLAISYSEVRPKNFMLRLRDRVHTEIQRRRGEGCHQEENRQEKQGTDMRIATSSTLSFPGALQK
jgi:hypothetical protein